MTSGTGIPSEIVSSLWLFGEFLNWVYMTLIIRRWRFHGNELAVWFVLEIEGLVQERRNSIADALELVFLALTHRNEMTVHVTNGDQVLRGHEVPLAHNKLMSLFAIETA